MGPSRMLELRELQDGFQSLLLQGNPSHLAAFFYWLDLQVAQFKVFGSCLMKDEGTPSQARKRLFGAEVQLTNGNGAHLPRHNNHSVLLDGSAGGALVQDRNGHGLSVNNNVGQAAAAHNNFPSRAAAHAAPVAHERMHHSSTSSTEDAYNLPKQQLSKNQIMVKSILRAMLAKSKADSSGLAMDMKQEQLGDSESEDNSDAPLPLIVKPVEESHSTFGSVSKDEAMVTDFESDTQLHHGVSLSQGENIEDSPGDGDEKLSRCPYCLKMFRYRSSYRRHVKIHEGIFSHECVVCMRKFTRKEHYVRHKCDRRPNKPYHLSHHVLHRERKSTARSAARNGHGSPQTDDKSARAYASNTGRTPDKSSNFSDVPLELTTGQLLRNKESKISDILSAAVEYNKSLQLSPDRCPVSGSPVRDGAYITSSVDGIDDGVRDGAYITSSVDGIADGGSDAGSSDGALLPHNENRRKSSTPRKIVNQIVPNMLAGDNYSARLAVKQEKFTDGIIFDISQPAH